MRKFQWNCEARRKAPHIFIAGFIACLANNKANRTLHRLNTGIDIIPMKLLLWTNRTLLVITVSGMKKGQTSCPTFFLNTKIQNFHELPKCFFQKYFRDFPRGRFTASFPSRAGQIPMELSDPDPHVGSVRTRLSRQTGHVVLPEMPILMELPHGKRNPLPGRRPIPPTVQDALLPVYIPMELCSRPAERVPLRRGWTNENRHPKLSAGFAHEQI